MKVQILGTKEKRLQYNLELPKESLDGMGQNNYPFVQVFLVDFPG